MISIGHMPSLCWLLLTLRVAKYCTSRLRVLSRSFIDSHCSSPAEWTLYCHLQTSCQVVVWTLRERNEGPFWAPSGVGTISASRFTARSHWNLLLTLDLRSRSLRASGINLIYLYFAGTHYFRST